MLAEAPTFSADDVDEFVNFLAERVGGGDGLEVPSRMEENRYRPSQKLMDHVASVIKNIPEYTLLDEQQVAFDAVMTAARRGGHDRQKQIMIIKRRARHRHVCAGGQPRSDLPPKPIVFAT